ncbi:hypothetical protein STEG23_005706 [Scotinomys teguina]
MSGSSCYSTTCLVSPAVKWDEQIPPQMAIKWMRVMNHTLNVKATARYAIPWDTGSTKPSIGYSVDISPNKDIIDKDVFKDPALKHKAS